MGSSYDDDWTVHQLKWTLKERGLPVHGNKHALIERLASDDANIKHGDGEGGVMGSSYDDWTVRELKDALKEKELPVHGNKRELIERLEISSRGKNYLEEWALDAGDAELVEQIKAKYRAPDYRPPESKDEKYTKISYAIIALCLLTVATIYFFLIEGYKQGDGFILPCFAISVLLFVIIVFIWSEVNETDIAETGLDEVPGAMFCVITSILMFCAFLWAIATGSPGEWLGFYFCSSMCLFILPIIALARGDEEKKEVQRRRASRKKRARDHKRAWKGAHKHEEHGQYDAATRIWSKHGEEGEVERVAGLKSECLCVILKRKIKDLTEMGADCTQLEEQLAVIETALEESTTSPSSIGTESEE